MLYLTSDLLFWKFCYCRFFTGQFKLGFNSTKALKLVIIVYYKLYLFLFFWFLKLNHGRAEHSWFGRVNSIWHFGLLGRHSIKSSHNSQHKQLKPKITSLTKHNKQTHFITNGHKTLSQSLKSLEEKKGEFRKKHNFWENHFLTLAGGKIRRRRISFESWTTKMSTRTNAKKI